MIFTAKFPEMIDSPRIDVKIEDKEEGIKILKEMGIIKSEV